MAAMTDGEIRYIQGSASKPYKMMCKGVVHSCDCASWRNQSTPINLRTCKHLKQTNGSAFEAARTNGGVTVAAPTVTSSAPTPATMMAPSVAGVGAAVHQSVSEETNEDIIAAVFGKRSAIRITEPVDPDAEYKQSLLDRAATEGRNLRQDEKAKVYGPPVLLANNFEDQDDLDPTGWWYSEKLDGVRGWYEGKKFLSRQGNKFFAPDFFTLDLPSDIIMDGELWMARQSFQDTLSIVRTQMEDNQEWKKIKFIAFDLPQHGGPWEERYDALKRLVEKVGSPYLEAAPHYKIQSRAHALSELKRYVSMGAEGIMLRKPGSFYEKGKSSTLLKMKDFKDAEAVVIGHEPGKGRHKGVLGALVVRIPNGVEFRVGTGFSDADRKSPPNIGDIITYSYTELTKDGKPKCGSFVAIRNYE